MSKVFRQRNGGRSIEEAELVRIGSFFDGNGVENIIYRWPNWGGECKLNQRSGRDPVQDSYLEGIGTEEAAIMLADYGQLPPPEIWEELRGRYKFDASGKPIIPKVKITPKGKPGQKTKYKKAFDLVKKLRPKTQWKDIYQRCQEENIGIPLDLKCFTRTMQAKLKKARDSIKNAKE